MNGQWGRLQTVLTSHGDYWPAPPTAVPGASVASARSPPPVDMNRSIPSDECSAPVVARARAAVAAGLLGIDEQDCLHIEALAEAEASLRARKRSVFAPTEAEAAEAAGAGSPVSDAWEADELVARLAAMQRQFYGVQLPVAAQATFNQPHAPLCSLTPPHLLLLTPFHLPPAPNPTSPPTLRTSHLPLLTPPRLPPSAPATSHS